MRRPAPRAATIASVVLMAVLAGACTATPAGQVSPAPSAVPTSPPQASPSVEPAPSAPVSGEVPAAVLEAAQAELATIVGADAAAGATLVTAEAVEWPDSSLGCPQPDMMYMQVITPGYRVVFEVDGERYDIRATESGSVVVCEPGTPVGG